MAVNYMKVKLVKNLTLKISIEKLNKIAYICLLKVYFKIRE